MPALNQVVSAVRVETTLGSFTVDMSRAPADGSPPPTESTAGALGKAIIRWLGISLVIVTPLGELPPLPIDP